MKCLCDMVSTHGIAFTDSSHEKENLIPSRSLWAEEVKVRDAHGENSRG